jgi:hypothetical protein
VTVPYIWGPTTIPLAMHRSTCGFPVPCKHVAATACGIGLAVYEAVGRSRTGAWGIALHVRVAGKGPGRARW